MLGRHGTVQARHPLRQLPAVAGRAYDCDAILDDPFVAPHHFEVDIAADGRLTARDLGSRNGTWLETGRIGGEPVPLAPDQTLRVGHTRLRLRRRTEAVPPELPASRLTTLDSAPAFGVTAALFLGVMLLVWMQHNFDRTEPSALLGFLLALSAALLAWVAVWALVGRTVTGQASFLSHGSVAAAGTTAMIALAWAADMLSFAFSAPWIGAGDILPVAAAFAAQLYGHLRLASRYGRARLAMAAGIASATLFGGMWLFDALKAQEDVSRLDAAVSVYPDFLRLADGASPSEFLARVDALVEAVEQRRKEP